jgi:vacuolar-type H+-ATPase catalytic subunit A/Vma1
MVSRTDIKKNVEFPNATKEMSAEHGEIMDSWGYDMGYDILSLT